jgi:hypothetical protein
LLVYKVQHSPTYVIVDGDTMENIQLNEAVVVAKKTYSNDTARYRYNQMKSYMKIVLPYALEAKKLYDEIESKSATMSNSERRNYIKTREKEIKNVFGDRLKTLNITQGKYLIKMINRLTGSTCYKIIADYHNPVRAAYHQTWGKLNNINLNETYIPANNRDFERIMKNFGY